MRYKYQIGQQVKVDLRGDKYYGKQAKVVQQHHGRNVLEFPNGDRADYLDDELKKA